MKIALVHGYLLSGTGSNIYTANLATRLAERGLDVSLFCQDAEAAGLDFVDDCYEFDAGNSAFYKVSSGPKRSGIGRVSVFRPRIGRLLPVFVYDRYAGFEAKEFHLLDAEEIETYVERNARAVRTVWQDRQFTAVQVNHLIAGPAIVRQALAGTKVPYYVTVHGSELNYSIKRSSPLTDLAIFGLDGASGVCASSDFLAGQVNDHLRSVGHGPIKIQTIYPGVDTDLFKPARKAETHLNKVQKMLLSNNSGGKTGGQKEALRAALATGDREKLASELSVPACYDRRSPDQDLPETLARIDWEKDQMVIFIGKYLAEKGLHALIMAAPLVLRELPRTRFLAVGFSDERELFEALALSLGAGRQEIVNDILTALDRRTDTPIGHLFMKRLESAAETDEYLTAAANCDLENRLIFTGPLAHRELAELLPLANLSVFPSIFPEAFGMVAVEALSAGVLPIATDAFGLAEITTMIRGGLSDYLPALPRLSLQDSFVHTLAESLITACRYEPLRRPKFKKCAHSLAVALFSWEVLADSYIRFLEISDAA